MSRFCSDWTREVEEYSDRLLDLENYPHLPAAEVALTRAADYQVLLGEVR